MVDAGARRPGGRAAAGLFLVVAVVYVASPVRQNFDSYLAFPTAHRVLYERTFSLDGFDEPAIRDHYGIVEVDGHVVNRYPWATSLWLVPTVGALDLAHAAGVGPGSRALIEDDAMDPAQVATAAAIAALTVVLVALIVLERLGATAVRRRTVALTVALAFAFGTGMWSTTSRAVWQHGPSLLALAVAVLALQRLSLAAAGPGPAPRAAAAVAGAAIAASYTFRPTNAIVVVVVTAFVALRLRPALAWYLAGAVAVAVPWLAVNVVAFGDLLPSYFSAGSLGWHDQYGEAVAANLVSPARGLLLFTPIVGLAAVGLLGSVRRSIVADGLTGLDRTLGLCVVLQLLVVSAAGDNWWAGHSYGPRFMTDSLVFLAVMASPAVGLLLAGRAPGPRLAAVVASIALVWSVAVASQGAVVRATSCWNGDPNIDQHPERVWDWGDAQFLAGVRVVDDVDSIRDAVLDDCAPTP